jgi:hypothetical protein
MIRNPNPNEMKKYTVSEAQIKDLETASFEDVARFVRKKKYWKTKDQTIFWTSPILTKWVDKLLELPFIIDFLFDYFQQSNTNKYFFEKALTINPNLLERAIKLSRAYENDEHWQCMDCIRAHENTRLRVFYKELSYLRKLDKHWKEKSSFYEGVISELDYEDILIHTVSSFERFKRIEQTIGNQSLLTSHEVHYSRVLNHILNIKRESQTDKVTTSKYRLSDFRKAALLEIGKVIFKSLDTIGQETVLIREVIDFYFKYLSTKYQIEKYLCDYADFIEEEIDGLKAELLTNDNFAVHWRNDKKSIFQETLAMNKALEKIVASGETISYPKLRIEQPIIAAIESWKYLCLPKYVKSRSEENMTIEAVITFLINFAINPILGADSSNSDSKIGKDIPQVLYPYIFIDGEEELIKNIASYFNWDRKTTESIINFLTTKLDSPKSPIDILSRPLIKIGTQYIWLSSLMKARRWDTLMHRFIAKERMFAHQEQSADMEEGLTQSFLDAGFKATAGWKYNQGKEGEGEIDTLAFKDNTLFVLELKTSFLDEDLMANNKYRELRLDYKAGDQLTKHLEYIEDNFESIKSIPELSINCDREELTIIPLIVSNIFEFDDQFINEQYQKVSLFELQVILRNDLYDALYNRMGSYLPGNVGDTPVANIFQNYNQFNPQFKKEHILPKDKSYYNLWSSPDACSPEDLLSAIKERKVWQGLDGMMAFRSGGQILIGDV